MTDDDYDEEDGLICASCGEWVLVYTNTGGPGLCYCPCCGTEWNEWRKND